MTTASLVFYCYLGIMSVLAAVSVAQINADWIRYRRKQCGEEPEGWYWP